MLKFGGLPLTSKANIVNDCSSTDTVSILKRLFTTIVACTSKGTGEGMSKSFGVWHLQVASFKTEVLNELLVLGHPLMRVCNLQGLAHFAVSFFDQ